MKVKRFNLISPNHKAVREGDDYHEILSYVCMFPGILAREIAANLGVSKSTVVVKISQLRALGLVARCQYQGDTKRAHWKMTRRETRQAYGVYPTHTGYDLYQQIEQGLGIDDAGLPPDRPDAPRQPSVLH